MRKEFSRRVKALAYKRCCDEQGRPKCEGCGVFLVAGNLAFDHHLPDGLGGEPTLENCRVLCIKVCHKNKTFKEDNPIMQKADRVLKKTFGIAKSKHVMPGSKRSGLRKKMDGTVVKR